ncbi:sensor domain-containing protein [Streptacidiphilus sp. PB12-B1b]|uniref:hypothetical protein n=1 Tax=Streptacidiphilus sp. PB12-B1b TaxID=2705012 RepID=UPI0015FA49A7|nr:hypothetical protein [Streptacidiphilus sp. PB12-B1b]QMU76916.1 sensor domain-containing protein [Streptacidiphilus sp. PB12-B1b]
MLQSVLLTAGSLIPGLQRAPASDHLGVDTLKYAASTGGPACTVFLNALNGTADAYHSLAEADRGYQVGGSSGGIQLETMLIGYASAAQAQRVLTDLRNRTPQCPKVDYTLNGNALALTGISNLPLQKAGDDSVGVQASSAWNGGEPLLMAVDTVREGSVVISIWVSNDPAPAPLLQLASTAAVVDLLQAEGAS